MLQRQRKNIDVVAQLLQARAVIPLAAFLEQAGSWLAFPRASHVRQTIQGFRIRPPVGRGMEVIVEITDRRSALVHYGRRWPEQRRFGGTLERFQQRTARRQLPLGGETLSIKHQRAGGELKHVRIELFQRGEDGILTRDTPLEKRLLVPGLELATAGEQACHPACK